MCARCVAPDPLRLFPCPARCNSGFVGRTQPSPVSIGGVNPELYVLVTLFFCHCVIGTETLRIANFSNEKQAWRCSKCDKLFDGAAVPLAEEERWCNSLRGLEVALASPEQNAQKLAPLRQNPEVQHSLMSTAHVRIAVHVQNSKLVG